MENFFNSSSLLKHINKWKIHLIIVAVVSIAFSVIFTMPFFIKPKFKSTAILYPANLSAFSSETPTEQMLQILQSNEIKDSVITKFDLFTHYGIKKTDPYYCTKILRELDDNVDFRKSQYESVEIKVFDVSAVMACNIANAIIDFYNKKTRSLHKSKSVEWLTMFSRHLAKKKAEMDSLEMRLQEIRVKYGILDYDVQATEATKGILKTNPFPTDSKEAYEILKKLQEEGGVYQAINEHLWRIRGVYNDIKEKYEEIQRDLEKEITYCHIISKPFPADKKSYPIRWLIVTIATASALFLAILIIIFIESQVSSR